MCDAAATKKKAKTILAGLRQAFCNVCGALEVATVCNSQSRFILALKKSNFDFIIADKCFLKLKLTVKGRLQLIILKDFHLQETLS